MNCWVKTFSKAKFDLPKNFKKEKKYFGFDLRDFFNHYKSPFFGCNLKNDINRKRPPHSNRFLLFLYRPRRIII